MVADEHGSGSISSGGQGLTLSSSLPLPVPCRYKYLVSPLLSEEEMKKTTAAVEEFRTGAGKDLQQHLEQWAKVRGDERARGREEKQWLLFLCSTISCIDFLASCHFVSA